MQTVSQAQSSLIHRLDARVKVVTALLLIIGILLTPTRAFPAYPLLWMLIGSLAEISRVGAFKLGRTAVLALPFVLTAVTVMFTTPGQPLTQILGMTITDAGVARFISIMLKSWLAVQVTLLLTLTTPFPDLLDALRNLGLPQTLVTIVALTYRYLFTLREEAERLIRARAARSGTTTAQKSGGGLLWRAQVAGNMVGSLFIRSYERSERVYLAMCARGYPAQLQTQRATFPPLREWVQAALPLLLLIVIELLALTLWS